MHAALMLLVMLVSATTPIVALADDVHTITVTKEGEGTAQMLYYFDQQQECNTGTEGALNWLIATPARHWRFKEWQLVSGDGTISNPDMAKTAFRIGHQNATVKAVFELQPVVYRTEPEGHGTFSEVSYGPLYFQFKPDAGYQVQVMTWYSDDPDVESSDQIDIQILQNMGGIYELPQSYGYVIATLYNPTSGTCGKKDATHDGSQVTWALSKSSGSEYYDVLTISGSGEMEDYDSYNHSLWYYYRNQIKTVVVGEGITRIGDYAFESFKNPEVQFTIPASVTSIGDGAFRVSALATIAIPNAVTQIGNGAFAKSTLTTITIPHDRVTLGNNAFEGCKALTTATIGQGVGSYEEGEGIIGKNAFYGCSALTTVNIGAGTTSIVAKAFYKCTALTTVTINDYSRLETIGEDAFFKCNKLSDITFGYGSILRTIDKKAFNQCTALTAITLPDAVTSIGKSAFDGCSALTTVTIPANVTSIDASAFFNCTALTTVNFAAGSQLQTIGKAAFSCKNGVLSSVGLLPATVTTIDDNAFRGYIGEHLYISVPAGMELSVKTKKADVTPPVSNNQADLKDCTGKKITIAMTQGAAHNINIVVKDGKTTIKENADWAYYFDATPITAARINETVALSWGGDDVPANKYVSGFTFDVDGVEAMPNEDNTEYTFIMPNTAVNVIAHLAPQEEFVLDLTDEDKTVHVITETQYILMNTLLGYFGAELDPMSGEYVNDLDLNRDGMPDLLLTRAIADDEESNDSYAHDYTVRRLPGLEYVTKNYHFAFEYPVPYRYNGMLVKLNDSYPEAVQPKIEDLMDEFDNTTTLSEWVADGQTHNVMLDGRTLYKDGDWNTLCLPFDVTIAGSVLDGDGVTAKTLNTSGTSLDTSTGLLTLSFETAPATILAGTPFIIKWNSSTDIVNPVFYGVTITSTTPTPVTSNDGNVTFVGQYSPFTIGDTSTGTFDGDIDEILLLTGGNMLGYSQNPRTLRSFRAHFYVPTTTAGARAVDSFVLDFGEGTGIAPLISPQGGTTHSPSGETEGAWYTLNGLRLDREPTAKGIYIHNGHKVVIK